MRGLWLSNRTVAPVPNSGGKVANSLTVGEILGNGVGIFKPADVRLAGGFQPFRLTRRHARSGGQVAASKTGWSMPAPGLYSPFGPLFRGNLGLSLLAVICLFVAIQF